VPARQPTGREIALEYGGFWRRLAAWIIDSIPLTVCTAIMVGISEPAPEEVQGVFMLYGIIVSWIYYAAFESSPLQATIGKLALGMRVTDLEGRRINFGRATGRHFAKIISGIILGIGFLMIAWDKRKQGLHDQYANTLVIMRSEWRS